MLVIEEEARGIKLLKRGISDIKVEMKQIIDLMRKYRDLPERMILDFLKDPTKEEIFIELKHEPITVIVSPNEMEARVRISGKPKLEEILEELQRKGIVHGVKLDAIVSALREGQQEFVAAEGTPPILGKNGYVEYLVELEKAPKPLEHDEKVDYRSLNIFTFVNEGDVVAIVHPPEPGVEGTTVTGKKIPPPKPRAATLVLGRGLELDDGRVVATMSGIIKKEGNRLYIEPVLVINGDVDFKVGNIDANINVEIRGWVRSGFTVKSQADIMIHGGVESNVHIEAGGSVSVKLGVMGKGKTVIKCGKDFYAKFVQDAVVEAEGNVSVSEYILNSDIRCKKSVFVNGKRGKLDNVSLDAGYSVHAKEIVGKKKTITIEGFDRIKIFERLKELNLIKVNMESQLKKMAFEIRKLQARKEEEEENETLKELVVSYKNMLEDFESISEQINELKQVITKIRGEGMLFISEKARDLKLSIKDGSVYIDESKSGIFYYDPQEARVVRG